MARNQAVADDVTDDVTQATWSMRQLDEFVGVYGNHAYGNVTVALNESGDGLMLLYGTEQFT